MENAEFFLREKKSNKLRGQKFQGTDFQLVPAFIEGLSVEVEDHPIP